MQEVCRTGVASFSRKLINGHINKTLLQVCSRRQTIA
jgi:hypothetical protein